MDNNPRTSLNVPRKYNEKLTYKKIIKIDSLMFKNTFLAQITFQIDSTYTLHNQNK